MSPLPRSSIRRALALSICLVALGIAGCGGGSSFVSQADNICRAANKQGAALTPPTNKAGLATYFDQLVAIFQRTDGKLKALTAPSDKRTAYAAYLSSLDQLGAILLRADTAARSGDVKGALTIVRQQSALSASSKAQAKALGLKICGR